MKKFILYFIVLLTFFPLKTISRWEQCNNTFDTIPIVTNIVQGFYLYFGTPDGVITLYERSLSKDTSIPYLIFQSVDLKEVKINRFKVFKSEIIACTNKGLYYVSDYSYWWRYINLKTRSVFSFDGVDDFLVVGTDTGVYYSTNYGSFWRPSSLQGITVYDVIYTEDGIFAGTESGLYFSSDRGNSWITLLPQSVSVLSLHKQNNPQNSQTILWAGTNQGLFCAKDNPLVWSKVGFGNDSVAQISSASYTDKTDSSVHNNVYVLTQRDLFYSTDFGETWNNLGFSGSKIRSFYVGKQFIVVTQNKVYLSKDYGKTWQKPYLYNPSKKLNVVAMGSRGNTLFASFLGKGLFYSTDYGDTWMLKQTEKSNINSFLVQGDTLVFSTLDYEIYTSTDNGMVWYKYYRNNLNVWSFVRWKDAILAATDDGIYISYDWGFEWNFLGLPGKIVLSLFANDGILIAGTSEGIFISNDNGKTWLPSHFPSQNVWCLAYCSGKYLAGSSDGLWASSDSGSFWYKVGLDEQQIYSIAPANSFVFVGSNDGVFVYYPNSDKIEKGYLNSDVRRILILDDYVFAGMIGFGIYRSRVNNFVLSVNDSFGYKNSDGIEMQNPLSGEFISISLKDELIGTIRSISFFDFFGREVYKNRLNESIRDREVFISKSHFDSGIYFIKITLDKSYVIKPIILLK